jgi:hypothetical protein
MTIYDDWAEQLAPWMTPDLDNFIRAISGMWSQIEVYIDDDPDNDIVAWQPLLDIDIAPLGGLPYLAQYVGERLPVGLNESQARDWIRLSPNWQRGTPQGIVNAVKRHLTGTQTVMMGEQMKLDGTFDVDTVSIATYAEETPDQNVILDVLRRNVPADLLYEYEAVPQATWAIVEGGMDSWAELQTTYGPTWAGVSGAKPGFNVWQ